MRVEIKGQSRTVELWLTREEAGDQGLRQSLEGGCRACRAGGYQAAVFLSGEADLCQQTRALLLYNRRRLAEQAVRAEGGGS